MNPTPTELKLRAELRDANARIAALDERLLALQSANEALYRAGYDTTGGPHFDPNQPFGQPADNVEGAAA